MNEKELEARGEAARRILDSPLYQEAIAGIESRIVNELAQQDIDPVRAEYLRTIIVAGRKHRTYMEQVLVTGTLTALDAERKRTLKQRFFGTV